MIRSVVDGLLLFEFSAQHITLEQKRLSFLTGGDRILQVKKLRRFSSKVIWFLTWEDAFVPRLCGFQLWRGNRNQRLYSIHGYISEERNDRTNQHIGVQKSNAYRSIPELLVRTSTSTQTFCCEHTSSWCHLQQRKKRTNRNTAATIKTSLIENAWACDTFPKQTWPIYAEKKKHGAQLITVLSGIDWKIQSLSKVP